MSRLKKALLALLVSLVALTTGLAWLYDRRASYSFAPEDPRQAVLAGLHADCVAYYLVLSRPPKGKDAPASEMGKRAAKDMELHAKFAFHFSPDKKALDAAVDVAVSRFENEVASSGDTAVLAGILQDREVACIRALHQSDDFFKDVSQRRASGN